MAVTLLSYSRVAIYACHRELAGGNGKFQDSLMFKAVCVLGIKVGCVLLANRAAPCDCDPRHICFLTWSQWCRHRDDQLLKGNISTLAGPMQLSRKHKPKAPYFNLHCWITCSSLRCPWQANSSAPRSTSQRSPQWCGLAFHCSSACLMSKCGACFTAYPNQCRLLVSVCASPDHMHSIWACYATMLSGCQCYVRLCFFLAGHTAGHPNGNRAGGEAVQCATPSVVCVGLISPFPLYYYLLPNFRRICFVPFQFHFRLFIS